MGDDVVEQLGDYETHSFSARELAALRYADALYFDHHGITEEQFTQLRAVFSEQEIVELTWVLVQFIALGKLIYVLGIPYGEGQHELDATENDTQEGATT
ncbi:MAG: hypothetical protein WD794_07530 [Mycobacteriales bacterium]